MAFDSTSREGEDLFLRKGAEQAKRRADRQNFSPVVVVISCAENELFVGTPFFSVLNMPKTELLQSLYWRAAR